MLRKLFLFGLALAVACFAGAAAQEEAPPSSDEPLMLEFDIPFDGLDDLQVYMLRPANWNPDGHKVLLYFVGGGQEAQFARYSLQYSIAKEAVNRGYVFVSPAAPCYDCTFVAKGDAYFPELFETLKTMIPMSEDRFHLMGFSNGGKSSLHIGTQHPEYVASITAYPGYLRDRQYDLLGRLNNTCVIMYVGEDDEGFLRRHRWTVAKLRALGHPVHEKIFPREGHDIASLWGPEGAKLLMDGIDLGWGCPEAG